MTVANEVPAHYHIVTARQIYRRLALIVLTVEKLVIFDSDVMGLIELDQIQSIVILHWIVSRRAPARGTLVMHLAVANRYVAGPEATVIPRLRMTTRRIIGLHTVESVFWFIDTITVNSVSSGI